MSKLLYVLQLLCNTFNRFPCTESPKRIFCAAILPLEYVKSFFPMFVQSSKAFGTSS